MQKTIVEQIARAKVLLTVCKHAAMATVNEDGSPHNSPFLFMHDDALTQVYWGSHPDALHSQNVLRTGQLFIVLYEADERGGLYMQAEHGHELQGKELETALTIHNRLRLSRGQAALPVTYYTGDSPQRMWGADIKKLWVNGTTRDADGRIIQDIRSEITARDILT